MNRSNNRTSRSCSPRKTDRNKPVVGNEPPLENYERRNSTRSFQPTSHHILPSNNNRIGSPCRSTRRTGRQPLRHGYSAPSVLHAPVYNEFRHENKRTISTPCLQKISPRRVVNRSPMPILAATSMHAFPERDTCSPRRNRSPMPILAATSRPSFPERDTYSPRRNRSPMPILAATSMPSFPECDLDDDDCPVSGTPSIVRSSSYNNVARRRNYFSASNQRNQLKRDESTDSMQIKEYSIRVDNRKDMVHRELPSDDISTLLCGRLNLLEKCVDEKPTIRHRYGGWISTPNLKVPNRDDKTDETIKAKNPKKRTSIERLQKEERIFLPSPSFHGPMITIENPTPEGRVVSQGILAVAPPLSECYEPNILARDTADNEERRVSPRATCFAPRRSIERRNNVMHRPNSNPVESIVKANSFDQPKDKGEIISFPSQHVIQRRESITSITLKQPQEPCPTSSSPGAVAVEIHKTIEIGPGVHVRLRTSDEMMCAVKNSFYIPCQCTCCQSALYCIKDADFLLCPDCQALSPIDLVRVILTESITPPPHRYNHKNRSNGSGGVCSGMKILDLYRMKHDAYFD